MKRFAWLIVLALTIRAGAEEIVVATYNVENFQQHFLAKELTADKSLPKAPAVTTLMESERKHEEEDNWEISQVILDPAFSPDVLVIQEGCDQKNLDYFVSHWLEKKYETAIVFPGNSDRNQNVEMLLKPGFKVIDKKDQYYLEKDTVTNERGDKLFARGPAFVLIETPGGYRFWVGTNHQKSKSGNDVDVTKWRNREATRTHEIIREVEKTGPSDVIFLGDMNDELWYQPFELQAGGDAISLIVGPPQDGITLVTRPLVEAGQISYFGYSRPEYRSFIDHIFVTRSLKDRVHDAKVFLNGFTPVASDHSPVMVHVTSR